MNLQTGAEWGVRLFAARNPTAEDRAIGAECTSIEALRLRLLHLPDVRHWHEHIWRTPPADEDTDLDYEEGIRWAYRLAFRREASDDDIRFHAQHIRSPQMLRRLLESKEFELRSPDARFLADAEIFRRFAPYEAVPPTKGSYSNALGAQTRLEFLDPVVAWKDGTIEGVPGPAGTSLHGQAEWAGSLRSVHEAKDRLVVVELGAGWAPWLVTCALAARKRGLHDMLLVGVEGSADHAAYMQVHFADNGLDPDEHRLLHAVIGAEDGHAYFPKLHDPSLDYGANAVFDDSEIEAAVRRGALEKVTCIGLPGLLRETGRVDLLHMDIQGHETGVLKASMPEMNALVRRAIIGTHSRMIDAELLALFVENGWTLEYDEPARTFQMADGSLLFPKDGEQVWRNDRV